MDASVEEAVDNMLDEKESLRRLKEARKNREVASIKKHQEVDEEFNTMIIPYFHISGGEITTGYKIVAR
jgi:hypothetical protein